MHASGRRAASRLILCILVAALPAAGGCGQTGALYLPEDDRPAPAEVPTGDEDEEQNDDEQ